MWACSSRAPRTRAQRAPGLCGPGTDAPLLRRTGRQASPTLQGWLRPGKGWGLLATMSGNGAGSRSAGHLGASTQTEAGWTLGVWAWELLPVGESGLGVFSARPGPPGVDALTQMPLGRPGLGRGQHPRGEAAVRCRGPEAGWPHGGVWIVGEGVEMGEGWWVGEASCRAWRSRPVKGSPGQAPRLGGSTSVQGAREGSRRAWPSSEARPVLRPRWKCLHAPHQVPPNVSPLL